MEELILQKLSRLNLPIKTRQLANRLNVSRTELAEHLNKLKNNEVIGYVTMENSKGDQTCGWIKIKSDPQ